LKHCGSVHDTKESLCLESRMHANVPVRFGRGRLDSLGNKGLAAYLIATEVGRVAVCQELDVLCLRTD